jgi:hypothetical protein
LRTSISAPAGGIRLFPARPASGAVIAPSRLVQSRSAWWFLPDIAMLAAAVTLFYSLFLFGGYQAFFHDSDAGWHIRTGERILQSGLLPRTDPFSFTAASKPWFAWEWLADVIVGTIYQFAGLAGVALFYASALAASVWLWFQLNWAAGGNFLLAACFAAPMLSTTNLHWLARPHVLSWLFLLAIVRFAVRPVSGPLALAGVALLSAFWANIHASFLMGPAILLIYAVGAGLNSLIFGTHRHAHLESARTLAVASAVALAATFVNPYGFHLHRHVIAYLTDTALLDRVGEFQSFNFHLAGSTQILLTLGIAATGAVLSLSRKDVGSFLLIGLLLVLALRSARGLPLVALLALPLANGAITQSLRGATGLLASFRKTVDEALNYGDRLRALDRHASGILWAPALLLLAAFALRIPAIAAHTGFPAAEFPVAASAEIAKLPTGARLLASDKFGGYLIFRFAGTRPVFFDGRSDLYGAQFLADYATLTQLRPGWQAILNRYNFTHALLPPTAPLIAALESAGWSRTYSDPVATLLARNGTPRI